MIQYIFALFYYSYCYFYECISGADPIMPTRRNVQYSPLPTEDRDNLWLKYTPKSHKNSMEVNCLGTFSPHHRNFTPLPVVFYIHKSHGWWWFSGIWSLIPGRACFPSWLLRDSSCLLFLERSTRVHLRIRPRLLAICVSRSVVVRQEGQARRELIEPQMELQNERLGMICIGNISWAWYV